MVKTEAFRNAEALEGMAAKWRYRWPSRHVPAASATLSVAYGRQALLDGVAGTAHRNRPAVQEVGSPTGSSTSLSTHVVGGAEVHGHLYITINLQH